MTEPQDETRQTGMQEGGTMKSAEVYRERHAAE